MTTVASSSISTLADHIARELRDVGEIDVAAEVDAAVRRARPLADDVERAALSAAIIARIDGLDRLDPLLADPSVDEILVGDGRVWIERHGALEIAGMIDPEITRRVVERVLAPLGRRLDRTAPIVDARLPDGSRVCAVVEPVAVDGPLLSIRRFADQARALTEFVPIDAADQTTRLCRALVAARCNVLVSGATSSGKTSLLAALLAEADPADRIVIVEDVAELPCRAEHRVRLEARPPAVDGPPPITLEQLVKTALRLRPDRLVVGEARGAEVVALLQAMNTGHDGSLSTVHANGATDALLRLESLVVRAAPQWPLDAVRDTISRSIDVVIHVERVGPRRRITEIVEVEQRSGPQGPSSTRPLVTHDDLSRRRS